MGATLTGTRISDTYDSLLKATDNGIITSSAKQITDGVGTNTPLYISTSRIGIGVSPTTTFQVSGNSKIGGDLTVTGNLLVEGTTTTVDTDTLSVKDPLIIVGNDNNTSDLVDLGFYGLYDTSGSQDLYAGLYRSASDTKFHLFKDLQEEPTTTVNTSGTGYTKADLVIGNLETTQVDLRDDEKIRLGDNQELEIYHFNNDYSWIKHSGTQALFIQSDELNIRSNQGTETMITASYNGSVDLWYDASKKLETTSTGVTVTGAVSATTFSGQLDGTISSATTAVTQSDGDNSTKVATTAYVDTAIQGHDTLAEVLAGGNTSGGTDIAVSAGDDITFTDTSKSIYGTDGELEIHHNGSNSYITEDGTGALYLQGTYMYLTKSDGSQNYIELDLDGATDSRVKLNYGGATKLETTSTGVSVTGNINLGDNNKILLGDGDDVEMYWNGSTFVIETENVLNGTSITTNQLLAGSGTHLYINFNQAIQRFYSLGNERLQVNQTGVTVSGDLTVDLNTLFVDASANSVGINLTNPSDYTVDDLVISVPDDGGMTLVSGTTDTAYIEFTDSTGAIGVNGGFISYNHNTDTLTNFAQSQVSIAIQEAEVAYFTDTAFFVDKSTTIDDNLSVSDDLGVGISVPLCKLDVVSSAADTARFTSTSSTTTNVYIGNSNATANNTANLYFMPANNIAGSYIKSTAIEDFSTAANRTSDLRFGVRKDGTFNEAVIIDSSGNVGIATDSPSATLDVHSPSTTAPSLTMGAAAGQIFKNEDLEFAFGLNNASPYNGWIQARFTGDNSRSIAINPLGGSVGIGTNSPTKKLTVNAGSTSGDGINVTGSSSPAIYINETSGTVNSSFQNDGAGSYLGTSTSHPMIFRTANTERMRIDSSGDVSIKTGYLSLDSKANNSASVAGEYRLALGHDASTDASWIQSNGASGTQRKLLLNPLGGNVGIGTDSPGTKLEVAETTTNTDCIVRIKATRDAYLQFSPANTTKWALVADYPSAGDFTTYNYPNNFNSIILKDNKDIITNTGGGNVGIGTTTPNAKLEITTLRENGIRLSSSDATAFPDELLSGIEFYSPDTSGGAGVKASIQVKYNDGDANSYMTFSTGTNTEQMRIDSSGQVLIGDTTGTSPNSADRFLKIGKSNLQDCSIILQDAVETWEIYQNDDLQFSFGTTPTTVMTMQRTTGNVGIGTTSPSAILEVEDSANNNANLLTLYRPNSSTLAASRLDFSFNTANGTQAVYSRIQSDVDVNTDSAQSGSLSFWTPSSGTLSERMRIESDGGIFFPSLGGFSVSNSDVRYNATSDELYYQTSSKRYKSEITDLENSLDKVNNLRPVRFKDNLSQEYATGMIAEEVAEIIPEVVFTKPIDGFDEPQIEGINYSDIVPFLIKSIQELKAEVEELRTQINN